MEFIEPNRSKYIVSANKPDDDGVLDIGVAKGTLCDGRPYRMECWRMDELYMATFFLDEMYITAWRRLDFALLLELEGLVKFKEEPLLQAARVEDDVGNNVWAVNVMLRNDGGEQAELTVPFMRYRKI